MAQQPVNAQEIFLLGSSIRSGGTVIATGSIYTLNTISGSAVTASIGQYTQVTASSGFKAGNGTETNLAYQIGDSTAAGFYSIGAGQWRALANAQTVLEVSETKFEILGGAGTTLRNNNDGTEAIPSYIFSNDTNTGIWRPANDCLAVSVNGKERFRVSNDRIAITGSLVGQRKAVLFVTGNYTAAEIDSGKTIHFDAPASSSLFIPSTLSGGFYCDVLQRGPNQVTVASSDLQSQISSSTGFTKTRAANSVISVLHISGNIYILNGDLGA